MGAVAVLVVFVVVVVFVYNTHRFYLCCNGLSKSKVEKLAIFLNLTTLSIKFHLSMLYMINA